MPLIIPVIDVKDGRVVRAIGGRRHEYQPIQSVLTTSTDPLAVAEVLLKAARTHWIYVADLDAIQSDGVASPAVDALIAGIREESLIWLDCGSRDPASTRKLTTRNNVNLILSMESLPPEILRHRLNWPRSRVTLSIELMNGRLADVWQKWGLEHDTDFAGLRRRCIEAAIRKVIVLDLPTVGSGVPAQNSWRPFLEGDFGEVIVGGGIRTWADAEAATEAGAYAILAASGFHDATLIVPPSQRIRRCDE